QRRVEAIVLERLAAIGQIAVGLLFGFEIDRGAVVGGADRAGEKGAVVARVVPGKGAVIASILPQADREFDRFNRLLAVQHDRLAVGLDLLAAPRPQIRIPERVGVAESVAERLAPRTALGLQQLAGGAPLFPSLWI